MNGEEIGPCKDAGETRDGGRGSDGEGQRPVTILGSTEVAVEAVRSKRLLGKAEPGLEVAFIASNSRGEGCEARGAPAQQLGKAAGTSCAAMPACL